MGNRGASAQGAAPDDRARIADRADLHRSWLCRRGAALNHLRPLPTGLKPRCGDPGFPFSGLCGEHEQARGLNRLFQPRRPALAVPGFANAKLEWTESFEKLPQTKTQTKRDFLVCDDFDEARKSFHFQPLRWRATVDEDGHYCFAMAL